jgi:hypothetical protein
MLTDNDETFLKELKSKTEEIELLKLELARLKEKEQQLEYV